MVLHDSTDKANRVRKGHRAMKVLHKKGITNISVSWGGLLTESAMQHVVKGLRTAPHPSRACMLPRGSSLAVQFD